MAAVVLCVCVWSDLGRCVGPERVHQCSLPLRAVVSVCVIDLVRVLFVYSSPCLTDVG